MLKNIIPGLLLTGAMTFPSTAADLSIEQFAPESSVVVISISDLGPLAERIVNSPLEEIGQAQYGEYGFDEEGLMERLPPQLSDMLKEMNEDGNYIEFLSKLSMGVAVYTSADPETGSVSPQMLAYIDFNEENEALVDFIDETIAKARKEGAETIEIAGRECIFIPSGDGGNEQQGRMPMGPDLSAFSDQDTYMMMEEAKGLMLFASTPDGIRRGIDAMEGEPVSKPLSESDDWKGMVDMLGDDHPKIVILTAHLGEFVSAFDSSGMIGFMSSSIIAVTGRINAMGLSISPGESPTIVQIHGGLYMPEGKSGLIGLISKNSPRSSVQNYLDAEVYGMSRYNFDFGGVIDWFKSVIRSNPILQAQGMQSLQQIEPMLEGLLGSLGDRMVSVDALSRPITSNSSMSISVFECTDSQRFTDTFSSLAADMGMEQGEFQGHVIYTMDVGGLMNASLTGLPGSSDKLAIALGGDSVFMGTRTGVEESLRKIGTRSEVDLSPNLKVCMASLPDRPMALWAISDIFSQMHAVLGVEKLQLEQSLRELAEDDPELAEEIRAEMEEDGVEIEEMMALMAEKLAGFSWATWSTDDGYAMTFSLLEAPEDDGGGS